MLFDHGLRSLQIVCNSPDAWLCDAWLDVEDWLRRQAHHVAVRGTMPLCVRLFEAAACAAVMAL